MKYRKKPVTVEAHRVMSNNADEWPDWLQKAAYLHRGIGSVEPYVEEDGQFIGLWVWTPSGRTFAEKGWWVLMGVEGELYPCKPSVFEATYEPVEDEEET